MFRCPQVWGTIVAGVVVMIFWARRSLRSREPFVDLRLLGTRNVALANILTVCLGLGTMQVVLVFSTFTQSPTWTMAGDRKRTRLNSSHYSAPRMPSSS